LKLRNSERSVDIQIKPDMFTFADKTLIRSVLENLIGNAWKFTSEKSETVIEFGKTDTKNGAAYFIRDNGAGFDMNFYNKLFGVFQRLHNHTEYPGTGIGLSTVQRIIQRHGGTIWAESMPGQGATFYFTIPEKPTENP